MLDKYFNFRGSKFEDTERKTPPCGMWGKEESVILLSTLKQPKYLGSHLY